MVRQTSSVQYVDHTAWRTGTRHGKRPWAEAWEWRWLVRRRCRRRAGRPRCTCRPTRASVERSPASAARDTCTETRGTTRRRADTPAPRATPLPVNQSDHTRRRSWRHAHPTSIVRMDRINRRRTADVMWLSSASVLVWWIVAKISHKVTNAFSGNI